MRHLASTVFTVALAAAGGFGGALFTAAPAHAEDCPGNPNALGTSRVLTVPFGEYTRLGQIQYPQTLPLAEKEVVITFDDGPLPPHTYRILDALAAQCVKATFFMVGEMAQSFPAAARRVHDAGHTIGTHSQNHPLHFDRLSPTQLAQQIDGGIASVKAALGDPKEVSPFFRIPGFSRSNMVENALASRSLIVFSADVVADDWRHISSSQIIARAMRRLDKRKTGSILLLHDIHATTAAAVPGLLKQLKERGYKVVQIVPGPATEPPEPLISEKPMTWVLASATPDPLILDDSSAKPNWPQPETVGTTEARSVPDDATLPAPDADTFDVGYADSPVASFSDNMDGGTPWPALVNVKLTSIEPELPAPSVQDIGIPVQERETASDDTSVEPAAESQAATSPERHRVVHARLHTRHRARAHAAGGQHAGLSVGERILAFFTPSR